MAKDLSEAPQETMSEQGLDSRCPNLWFPDLLSPDHHHHQN